MSVKFPGVSAPSLRRVVLGLALLAATAVQASTVTPEPRRGIDPDRYLGRWYEIARYPNMIQDKCEAPTSDWTKGSNGQYDVVQTCHIGSPSGPAKVWRGAGRIIAANNSKIRIGFFGGFVHQDYWIVDRSDDYSWCIMGTPNPRFVWIMSRRAVLSDSQRAALVARARALGYDTSNLVFDRQPPTS
jgi:apolipoprotein D and lipocalin family protein